jgi:N-acetylmuramoyl-L-alanine amidase
MAEIKEVTVYGSNQWSDLKPLALSDEDLVQIPWDKYEEQVYDKKQIVLHHTVSGPGIRGDLATWKKYKSAIATCIIVERDGTINQLFSSKYFGWHLGCGKPDLDRHSIAIELDNWGQLEERDGQLFTVYDSPVDVETVHYPQGFRGEQVFEAYSVAQLRAVGELLLLWNKTYGIPLDYNPDMWDVSDRALGMDPGVWTHVSYRPWPASRNKWDCHPDPNLISMLRTISGLV